VPSACIEANTDRDERKKILERFKRREIQVLTNMMALTEGVDVPSASVCIIARPMGHVSMYLQSAGRVMRPAPGKSECLLIDLPGLSHRFGPPNENRLYSLDGEAIQRQTEASLRVCQSCGFTFVPKGNGLCPRCGIANIKQEQKPIKIFNEELHSFFNGPGTPDWAKKAELARLEGVAREKGYNDAWVARQFKATFAEMPQAWAPTDDRKRAEYRRLVDLAKRKGWKLGAAAMRYKATYGTFPPRSWSQENGEANE
jgi:DNA repair protein RadD